MVPNPKYLRPVVQYEVWEQATGVNFIRQGLAGETNDHGNQSKHSHGNESKTGSSGS